MAEEKVLSIACPMKVKLILPNDCVVDEHELQERIETSAPILFRGLCDACPHYRARNRG